MTTFSAEALGEVIRARREAKGFTQDALGTAAGYGSGAGVSISRIESGLTRPGPERFEGLARALELTPDDLERQATNRTSHDLGASTGYVAGSAVGAKPTAGRERLKDRARRIEDEIAHRTALVTDLGDAFNDAHDRARDDFFMRFVDLASDVEGAPQPDPLDLSEGDEGDDVESEATARLRFTSHGIAQVLAGGAGGAAAGAAVGGAAAYGTFIAAVSFGTASTGAAISGLSGVAATNAALALLGGGTLAAGGSGVAGGTMLLTSIVAAPAVLLAVGGLVWMARRNRKQQEELADRLDDADAEIAATKPGFDALVEILRERRRLSITSPFTRPTPSSAGRRRSRRGP